MTVVRLGLTPDRMHCAPGDRATVTVAVRNVSDVVQHYETSVLGLPAGVTAHAEPARLKLRPGERGAVRLDLTLAGLDAKAPSAPPRAGTYTLGVLVRSPHHDGTSTCEELPLVVDETEDVRLSVEPQLLAGGAYGRFATTVANRGNAPARVHLKGHSRSGEARFVFSPAWVDVPPQGRSVAEASVSCRTPWTGPPRQRSLTVTGLVGDPRAPAAERTTTLELTQRAKLAPAALRSARGLVTLGVGVATVLGGALLVRATDELRPQSNDQDSDTGAGTAEPSASGSADGGTSTETGTETGTTTGSTTETGPETGPGPGPATGEQVDVPLFAPPGFESTEPEPEPTEPVPTEGPVTVDTSAYADGPISVVAGVPSDVDPACADATGLSVVTPGDPDGYAQPAHPDDASLCNSGALEVRFDERVSGVDVFLSRASYAEGAGKFAMKVETSGPREEPLIIHEPVAPGEPDFSFSIGDALITTIVISQLDAFGTDEATPTPSLAATPSSTPDPDEDGIFPTGISHIRVTLADS